jgi:hypothetical protein
MPERFGPGGDGLVTAFAPTAPGGGECAGPAMFWAKERVQTEPLVLENEHIRHPDHFKFSSKSAHVALAATHR